MTKEDAYEYLNFIKLEVGSAKKYLDQVEAELQELSERLGELEDNEK